MKIWNNIAVGDALTLQRGFDLPAQKLRLGKVPVVSSSGDSCYHSEVGVKGSLVVTGRYGTIGQVFLFKEDGFSDMPVIVPPLAIQGAFGKIVGGWFEKIFAHDHPTPSSPCATGCCRIC